MKIIVIYLILWVFCIKIYGQPCLPEGIVFTTQEQIDSFQIQYPGCSEIAGNAWIAANPSLSGLTGLENITSLTGDYCAIFQNQSLSSLSGLQNLVSVSGDFGISDNNLHDLSGLGNLSTIGGNFMAYRLKSYSGLESLVSVGGLYIKATDRLQDLSGLEHLTTISDDLVIAHNDSLTDISALINLEHIGGDLFIGELNWGHNYMLKDLHGLEGISSVPGNVMIHSNAPGCNDSTQVQSACHLSTEEIRIGYGVSVNPNPSNDNITLSLTGIDCTAYLEVFNVNGDKVIEQQIKGNNTQISISALPPGVYFVKVQNEQMTEVTKLVKQ